MADTDDHAIPQGADVFHTHPRDAFPPPGELKATQQTSMLKPEERAGVHGPKTSTPSPSDVMSGTNSKIKSDDVTLTIHEARRQGIKAMVEINLSINPAALNETDKHGQTALHIAAARGDMDIVRILLSAGADIEGTQFHPSWKGVERFFSRRSDNPAIIENQTPLQVAIRHEHQNIAQYLIEHGAQVNAQDSQGTAPLHLASSHNDGELVSVLLQHQSALDICNNNGATPLYVAAEQGHTDIVKLLLDRGAGTEFSSQDGATPLFIAAENGHTDIVTLLLQHGSNTETPCRYPSLSKTPLFAASALGHKEIVRFLLDHGAETNFTREDGVTPLYAAARNGHTHIVRMLLAHDAEKSCADQDGLTPLFLAAANGHTDIVQLLLDSGAEKDFTTKKGTTPLFVAAHSGHTEVVRLLLQCKANTEIPYDAKDGLKTPLFIACQKGHTDIVTLLLDHGAEKDSVQRGGAIPSTLGATYKLIFGHREEKDSTRLTGRTPLHAAAERGHKNVVKVLLQWEADVNRQTDLLETPLHLVADDGRVDIAQLLISRGADISMEDMWGQTPMVRARNGQHTHLTCLLKQKANQSKWEEENNCA